MTVAYTPIRQWCAESNRIEEIDSFWKMESEYFCVNQNALVVTGKRIINKTLNLSITTLHIHTSTEWEEAAFSPFLQCCVLEVLERLNNTSQWWQNWRIPQTQQTVNQSNNCYNIMNPHGLSDLPLLFNSLFHDTTLNLACVHFESQHQKCGIYCLLVSVILHHCLHFVGI